MGKSPQSSITIKNEFIKITDNSSIFVDTM